MAWGTMAVDWETRVDYERLRAYRLGRAKEQLEKHKLGSMLLFDFNNIRYVTGTHVGEWARDKFARYALLPRGGEPYLWETGSAASARRLMAPWMSDRIQTAVRWARGAVPQADEAAEVVATDIRNVLSEYGLEKEPVAVDLVDMIFVNACRRQGLELVDAMSPMLDARLIKNQDEIQLMRAAATLADACYESLYRAIKPGIRENELVAIGTETLYRLGSELVECIHCISGSRQVPHPHVFSDRIVRPGDTLFFDIMHSFNGYRTCYYRTFAVGRPTQEQIRAYRQCYDWVYAAVDQVRPGITTADLAAAWPPPETWGYKNEREARGMASGHGIGLSIHEKPVIGRLISFDKPFPIQENMVICLEVYNQTPDKKHGMRIEEIVLVTKDGHEVLTKWPSKELVAAAVPTMF